MKWCIFMAGGGRHVVYALENNGSDDRERSVKIEGFLPDRQFWGGVSIYPYDAYRRVHDAETWYRTRLARICTGDSEASSLLNYVIDLRCGTIPPKPSPRPRRAAGSRWSQTTSRWRARAMNKTPTELQENDKAKVIEKDLNAITRALTGDDEERRQRGLALLSNAPPAVARRLADKLVPKLQRGGDVVRERAQAALVAAGKHAVFAMSLTALKSRNAKQQILGIDTLLAIGARLGEADRANIVISLIGMLFADRDESVRGAAMRALVALRRG